MNLAQPLAFQARLESWLDLAEQERASRYATTALRHEFVTTRGVLRLLLAARTAQAPAAVTLHLGPRGKPATAAVRPCLFNVSHSGGLALFALSTQVEVGIDVEGHRPLPDVEQLVERVMNTTQAARWRRLPAAEQVPAFYRDWTRKEASVKASGDGLWAELRDISFEPLPDPLHPGRLRGRDAAQRAWGVLDLDMGAGHTAALAWCGDPGATVAPLRWLDADALSALMRAARQG